MLCSCILHDQYIRNNFSSYLQVEKTVLDSVIQCDQMNIFKCDGSYQVTEIFLSKVSLQIAKKDLKTFSTYVCTSLYIAKSGFFILFPSPPKSRKNQ